MIFLCSSVEEFQLGVRRRSLQQFIVQRITVRWSIWFLLWCTFFFTGRKSHQHADYDPQKLYRYFIHYHASLLKAVRKQELPDKAIVVKNYKELLPQPQLTPYYKSPNHPTYRQSSYYRS